MIDQPISPLAGGGSPDANLIDLQNIFYPFLDLRAQNVPRDTLKTDPRVVLTLSMLAGMSAGVPKLVKINPDGTMFTSVTTDLAAPIQAQPAGRVVGLGNSGPAGGVQASVTVAGDPNQSIVIDTIIATCAQQGAVGSTPAVQLLIDAVTIDSIVFGLKNAVGDMCQLVATGLGWQIPHGSSFTARWNVALANVLESITLKGWFQKTVAG